MKELFILSAFFFIAIFSLLQRSNSTPYDYTKNLKNEASYIEDSSQDLSATLALVIKKMD